MDFVYLFLQLFSAVVGHVVIFDGPVIFALIVVGQPYIVEKVVIKNLIFLHFLFDALIGKAQSIEDVSHIFMRIFVFFIFFDTSEIPLHGFRILAHHLVSGTYVVVARGVLRRHQNSLFVPFDRLFILFAAAVAHADLVYSSSITRVQVDDSCQNLYLFGKVSLVACHDEESYSVLRLNR